MPDRATQALVLHRLGIVPVMAALLNCDTLKLPTDEILQVLTLTEYIKVLVPTVGIRVGVITPVCGLSQLPMPVENVPPPGVTVIVFGEALVQKGNIGEKLGVCRFTAVTEMVLVIGQFTMAGVTVTEYVVVTILPGGIFGAMMMELFVVFAAPPCTQRGGFH